MKRWTKRKYVGIWYVNIGDIDPTHVPAYLDSFQKSLCRGASHPWQDLEVLLEAPVLGYFIPTRISDTRLEIEEIKFEVE